MRRDGAATRDRVLLELERPSPRLPRTSLSLQSRLPMAALVHAVIGVLLLSLPTPNAMRRGESAATTPNTGIHAPRMVFVAPPNLPRGGGGGGGGNRRVGPLPRAQARGQDALTTPVVRLAQSDSTAPPPNEQHLLLDAKPLASGTLFLSGLPDAGPPLTSEARGPGSGGGFGEGEGTGIGSGTGPGVGSGTGGGAGGGVYRPGGAVSAPVLLTQVRPTYTAEAMTNRIQGAVALELIVRRNGEPDAIRVVRSLDRGGLDVEAVHAVRQWRFRPGRLGDTPVDVLVTVIVNFHLY
ncbi:MAG: energy transducer TonB [Acidobacteria bacterium]|nr:energy transducer TonB [Acidobacteriota bacterium]